MNKTILVAGGTAVVSLAAGAAGGYFIAYKRFEKKTREEVKREVDATKKYYSVLLMNAQSGKSGSPADIPKREKYESATAYEERLAEVEASEDESETEPGELSEKDRKAYEDGLEKIREKRSTPRQRTGEEPVDYNGISTKKAAVSAPVVEQNVFDTAEKKRRPLPPRDATGAFRKRTPREEENDPPQIIDEETFLANELEHNQETLLYFKNDNTLILEADPNEVIDLELVGRVNLTLFPPFIEGIPCTIWVQNTALSVDYEIKLMQESLTDYIGLGENSDGDDDEELDPASWV